MLPNMGFGDWIIVAVLVLLLFGAKRLPDLARSIGQSLSAFKKGMREGEKTLEDDDKDRKDKGEGK